MTTPRLMLITITGTLAYLGLAILGWGGFAAFFSHPPLIRGRCRGCAAPKWDQRFESGFLQRRVFCEPDSRSTATKRPGSIVTSMPAPVASGWSGRRVGLAPTGKRRLVTAHVDSGRSSLRRHGQITPDSLPSPSSLLDRCLTH
jgi:hypothetical protein